MGLKLFTSSCALPGSALGAVRAQGLTRASIILRKVMDCRVMPLRGGPAMTGMGVALQ
jgi:hypothetical protein